MASDYRYLPIFALQQIPLLLIVIHYTGEKKMFRPLQCFFLKKTNSIIELNLTIEKIDNNKKKILDLVNMN
jgi:hypothetical protein